MKTKVKETLFDEDYWEDILYDAHDHSWEFDVGDMIYYISQEGINETLKFFVDCRNAITGEEYPRIYFQTVKEMLEEHILYNGQTIKEFCIEGCKQKKQH